MRIIKELQKESNEQHLLTVYVATNIYNYIESLAKENKVTKAAVLRYAIKKMIQDLESGIRNLD